jgi:prevent-host-death family protein
MTTTVMSLRGAERRSNLGDDGTSASTSEGPAMDTWKLQDAKARFSEVVDRALDDGPQVVTRHGENTVVLVAYREFIGAEPAQDFKRRIEL